MSFMSLPISSLSQIKWALQCQDAVQQMQDYVVDELTKVGNVFLATSSSECVMMLNYSPNRNHISHKLTISAELSHAQAALSKIKFSSLLQTEITSNIRF